MRVTKALLIVALAGMTGGCPPPSYGVSREFRVAEMPNSQCIRDGIAAMPDMKNVTYNEYGGGKDLVGTSIPVMHQYAYQQKAVSGGLFILTMMKNGRGEVWIGHSQLDGDKQKARAAAQASHRFMLQLEAELIKRCGMNIIESTLKQSCDGCTLKDDLNAER
jgi:hypothetical protein